MGVTVAVTQAFIYGRRSSFPVVFLPSRSYNNGVSNGCNMAREYEERTYTVCLCRFLQGIDLVDLDLQLTGLEQVEEFVDIEFKFLTGLDVAEEHGTSDLDTLRGQTTV